MHESPLQVNRIRWTMSDQDLLAPALLNSVHGAVARLHSVLSNVWPAMEYSCVGTFRHFQISCPLCHIVVLVP